VAIVSISRTPSSKYHSVIRWRGIQHTAAHIATHCNTHCNTLQHIHFTKKRMFYEVATISRLLKIIGLFCRISSLLQGSFATETYNLKEPTNRSHPIRCFMTPWGGQVFKTARHCKTLQFTGTHRGWQSTNTMAKVQMFPLKEEIKFKIF